MKLFIILLFAIYLNACEPSRPSNLQIFSEAQFSGMRTDLSGNFTKLKLSSPLITNSIRVSTGNYTLFTSSNYDGEQFTVSSNGGPNEDGNYPTTSNWGSHGIIIIRSVLVANTSNITIANSKNNANSRGLKLHGRILLNDNREDTSVESNKDTNMNPNRQLESDESTSQYQAINSSQINVTEAINKPTGSVVHTSAVKVNQSTTKEEAKPTPVLPEDSDEGLFSSVKGAPSEGAPSEGTPSEGIPSEGIPSEGTPSEGTPGEGTPSEGAGKSPFSEFEGLFKSMEGEPGDKDLFSSVEGEPSEGAGKSQLSEFEGIKPSSVVNGNDVNKDSSLELASSLEGNSENVDQKSNSMESMDDMNSMSDENFGSQEGSESKIEDDYEPIEEGDGLNSDSKIIDSNSE